MAVSVDQLLLHLGQPGRYQVLVCILLCFNYFQICFNHLCMSFFGAAPLGYRCGQTEVSGSNYTSLSGHKTIETESCLRYGSSKADIVSWCAVRQNCSSCNVSTPFYMEDREWTIVAQFDLVCDKTYMINLATTIYFLGVTVGGLVFGYFADTFGRLPVLIATTYLPTCVGIGLFFTNSYTIFVILRFIIGFLIQGLQISMHALAMEFISPKQRAIVASVLDVFWCLGVFLFSLIAFLIRDWRWMQLCISLSTLITLSYVWLYPESLRWLVAKGKRGRAEKLIKTISRYNGLKDVPSEISTLVYDNTEQSEKEESKVYSTFDILRNGILLKRSVILWFMWLAVSMGYFGLAMSTGSLPGHKYSTSLIGAGVELAANMFKIPAVYYLGRRWPLTVLFLAGGISCIVSGVIEAPQIKTSLAMVGRFGMSGAFGIMLLYTSELYPTPMRSVGMGTAMFWTRVGSFLAPQISLLGTVTYPELTFSVFGVLSIVAGFCTLILPETWNQKLPDTVADVEAMGWGCFLRHGNAQLDMDEPAIEQRTTKL